MTFEKIYGQWLVGELNALTVAKIGRTCKQYDEVAYKALRRNPDSIAVIINGGGAARSNVQGLDQNNATFAVLVICKNDYAESVIGLIDVLQRKYNAQPMLLTFTDESGEQITQRARSVFFSPTLPQESDYQTDKGTIKAAFIYFTISVSFGMTAVVEPSSYKLIIDTMQYDVNHISREDVSSSPAYDTYLAQGDSRPQQRIISANNAYALTIIKVEGDALQKVFEDELSAKRNEGLFGKSLVLERDGKLIPVRTYQLTRTYEDNAAAYVLTLGY